MSVTDWSYVKFLLSDHNYLFAMWIYHQCIKGVAIACFQQVDINIFFFKFRYKDICVSWSKNSVHSTSFRLKKVFAIKTSINATKIVVTFVATGFFLFFVQDCLCRCNSLQVRKVGAKGLNMHFYKVCFFRNIPDGFYFIENVFYVSYARWNLVTICWR